MKWSTVGRPILKARDYPPEIGVPHITLLVVEDNPGDVNLINVALKHCGFDPTMIVASDGDEAIVLMEKIEAEALPCPDLIVVDINLPKRNGFEVLQKVRESYKCKTSPVVIFSSSDSVKDREQALQLGATHYIKKPFSLTEAWEIGRQLVGMFSGGEIAAS